MGQLDGKDIFDTDLDSLEDKPWRKPGADLTDYFNFGFNEVTWRAYCAKQKLVREETLMQKRIHVSYHFARSVSLVVFFFFLLFTFFIFVCLGI